MLIFEAPMKRRLFLLSATLAFAASTALPAFAATTLSAAVAPNAKEAFEVAVSAYEKSHPGITISTTYAGSKDIGVQVTSGAGVDVVILGTPKAATLTANLDGTEVVFKEHTAIAVAKSAAGKVKSAQDLIKPGVRIGKGVKGTFAGDVQQAVLERLGSAYGKDFETKYEANVTTSRGDTGKLTSLLAADGIDAAIVFAAEIDLHALTEVALPAAATTEVAYSAASTKTSAHAGEAKAFVAWLLGPDGHAIFKAHRHDVK